MNGHFPAKRAKYSNFHITKTTQWIPTKFCQNKDLQVLLVDGSKMRPTNSIWRTAAILKSRTVTIFPQPFDRF